MSAFRTILAAVIVLLCAVSSQACLIESLLPAMKDCCCESNSQSELPNDSCAQCATLETGTNPTETRPLVVTMPALAVDEVLSLLLGDSLKQERVVREWHVDLLVESLPIWQLVARTSVPVRGPSLA